MNTISSNTPGLKLRRPFAGLALWCGVVVALLHTGCSILPKPTEDPTRYFVLTFTAPSNEGAPAPSATAPKIGLKTVELPGYLHNNRTIVVRDGVNEIRYEDYARWAEPLETGLHRLIKERLLASGGIGGVVDAPFLQGEHRDYDVSVRVIQCEGGAASGGTRESARFSAAYEIASAAGNGQVLVRKTFVAPESSWDGKDFSALVRLLSDDTAKLADDIAANLPK